MTDRVGPPDSSLSGGFPSHERGIPVTRMTGIPHSQDGNPLLNEGQMWRRDWMTRKREATYAPSVYDAVAAGLAPVPWKSE
jgi:hypothetical protein